MKETNLMKRNTYDAFEIRFDVLGYCWKRNAESSYLYFATKEDLLGLLTTIKVEIYFP